MLNIVDRHANDNEWITEKEEERGGWWKLTGRIFTMFSC